MALPSMSVSGPVPSQDKVYQNFLLLHSLAARRPGASLAGALVLTSGMGSRGMELAMAATLGGAAFLGVEPRPQRLKHAMRHCACDFMVNTLDEALRVLKNQVRKRQPVSVGLLGNAAEVLPQIVLRGVQPDFLFDTSPLNAPEDYVTPAHGCNEGTGKESGPLACRAKHRAALEQLAQRGAHLYVDRPSLPSLQANAQAPGDAGPAGHVLVSWKTDWPHDMDRLDMLVASQLPATDQIRRQWLSGIAGCFHRQRPLEHLISLLPTELAALRNALQRPSFYNALERAASLHWMDNAGKEQVLPISPSNLTTMP